MYDWLSTHVCIMYGYANPAERALTADLQIGYYSKV